MNNPNMDKIAAEVGFELAEGADDPKELERVTNKALGILIEDGLFAYTIWLESENEVKIINKSFELLRDKVGLVEEDYGNIKDKEKLREAILKEISTSLEKTLLARHLLERMLVYARYRAKSLG